MGKWFKEFQALIWAVTLITVAMVWAYQSFATIAYVDTKHAGVMEVLNDIRDHVRMIDERTYELAQRKR